MENDKLIHEYIDGTIDDFQEEQLFNQLAQDQSARADFKQQLKITSAVHKDFMAYTPKAESTLKIFQELGFSPTSVAPVPVKGFWARNYSNILSGFASAAAAVVITLLLIKPNGNNVMLDGEVNKFTSNIPIVSSKAIEDNTQKTQTPQIIYKYVYVNKVNSDEIAQSNFNQEQAEVKYIYKIVDSDTYDNRYLAQLNLNPTTQKPIINNMPFDNNSFDFVNNYKKDGKFTVEFGGAGYYNIISGSMHPSQYQALNNTNIAAYYKTTDELSIGMDYRRENYYEKFRGVELSQVYEYEQNPNFQMLSLAARYKPKALQIGMVSPLVEVSTGIPVNKLNAGYVIRPMMLGVEVKPFKDFKIMAGVDYSILYYKQQNNFYSSNKFGVQLRAGWEF